jgi:hypothetical protein
MKKFSQSLGLLFAVIFVVTSVAVVSAEERVSANSCLDTGVGCKVGMTGPRGGIIFYDAGSQQWWGRFLEAERRATRARSIWGSTDSIYGVAGNVAAQRQSMAIGMGRVNTGVMRASGSPLATLHTSEGSDWYIPSKDELDTLYNFRTANPRTFLYRSVPFWTSSESEDSFAWYQLFQDGTQFTDANGILAGVKTNKSYTHSAVHVGSAFVALPMNVVRVRSFPYTGAQPPIPTLFAATTDNPQCAMLSTGCRVGDIGPGGGIVVYDAGVNESWGRYLEIAPKSCEVSQVAYSTDSTTALFPNLSARIKSKELGSGRFNTEQLKKISSPAALAAVRACNGLTDWFLPSKNELNEAFRLLSHGRKGLQLTPVGQFERGYYWTSSDYNGSTAWTQYFADGQQFDRVQTLTGNRKPPARPFNVRPMRAFSSP